LKQILVPFRDQEVNAPKDIHILSVRGDYLESLDRKEEARGCFQRALTLLPGDESARQGLQRTVR
jgi:predicted RNA polymerase sigma factor